MSSLSENNNSIIATSYQNKVSISAHITTTETTMSNDPKNINEIWKNNFNKSTTSSHRLMDLDSAKISWANLNNNNNPAVVKDFKHNDDKSKNEDDKLTNTTEDKHLSPSKEIKNEKENEEVDSDNSISNTSINGKVEIEKFCNDDGNDNTFDTNVSPSHHARRPMNAFLIFCKKHRPIVRKKFPALENRGVTRILGEWWSLLDSKDKDPYTKLAKQYKDAFFTANPDFKWYKLPAPPLRTLPTRPTKSEICSPPISPTLTNATSINFTQSINNNTPMIPTADFTPGKLADESQLGMLSSLLTGNSYVKQTSENLIEANNNNNNSINIRNENSNETTPITNQTQTITETPPKPFKKRMVSDIETNQKHEINNKIVRNLFEEDKKIEEEVLSEDNNDVSTNGRKSFRKGKGNRYADIMANGKLIKNKRSSTEKIQIESVTNNKLELNTTIKKLQERLLSNGNSSASTSTSSQNNNEEKAEMLNTNITETPTILTTNTNCTSQKDNSLELTSRDERIRTISEVSEMSDVADYSKAIPSFDLDSRIADLPNLSYETYVQRKKDAKKRKLPKGGGSGTTTAKSQQKPKLQENKKRSYDQSNKEGHENCEDDTGRNNLSNGKVNKIEKQTGSKKRKNKHNITHLENNSLVHTYENDLSGLNTLAEIASNLSTNNNNKIL